MSKRIHRTNQKMSKKEKMRFRKGIVPAGATCWQDCEVVLSGQVPNNKAQTTHELADDPPADATCAGIVVTRRVWCRQAGHTRTEV